VCCRARDVYVGLHLPRAGSLMRPGTCGPTESAAVRTMHIVVSCTDRKTREPHSEARARALPHGGLGERISAWRRAMEAGDAARLPAADLYAGDHWQVVRSLAGSAPEGVEVRIWVCSAENVAA
jgi:hypothetical protein